MDKTILVAEDDSFLIKMYQRVLDRNKWSSVIVTNGEETIEKLKEEPLPDLLILDLHMPKIDGFAVLEYMYKNKVKTPVIVLTNLSHEVDQKKCKELGAKDFFVKSDMELEDLADLVKKHLKKK